MDIFERLKASAPAEWSSYVDHAFVRQMETGRFATGCIGTLSAEALAESPVLAKPYRAQDLAREFATSGLSPRFPPNTRSGHAIESLFLHRRDPLHAGPLASASRVGDVRLIDEPEHVAKRRGRGCVREPVRARGSALGV
jgi:hypothetical protein